MHAHPTYQADPDPTRLVTREDLADALTRIRTRAGLTIRELAALVGIPASTLGGYFSGTHLPTLKMFQHFEAILRACGISDPAVISLWRDALIRIRSSTEGDQPNPESGRAYPQPGPAPSRPSTQVSSPVPISVRAPVERLRTEPRMRGRTDLLAVLATSLDQPQTSRDATRIHVLHGIGGCGKSMAVLTVARQSVEHGIRTWWVSAADPHVALAGMQAIALDLGAVPDRLSLGSSPDQLWRLLTSLPEPWMLFIDNADDPVETLALPGGDVTDGTGWLRPITGPYGAVIVTTRDGSTRTWGSGAGHWLRLRPVGRLADADGALLLTDLAGDAAGSLEAAQRLSGRLGGLPLALRLAGRFLREAIEMPADLSQSEPRTFDDYAQALDEGRHRELLDGAQEPAPAATRIRERIGHTWELSLDLLDLRGMRWARPTLRLLSCFGPAPVSFGRLLQPAVLSSSALFCGITAKQLWSGLRGLADFGLVDLQQERADAAVVSTLVIHPLVRDTSRCHAEVAAQSTEYLQLIIRLLVDASRDLDPKNHLSWPRWQAIASHCGSPLDFVRVHHLKPENVPDSVLRPAALAAQYLRAAGYLARAEAELRSLIAAGRTLFGDENPEVLCLRHELGRVWYQQGRYNRAKRELHAVVAGRREALGPEHPDTLVTEHYLGRTLRDHGQLDLADRYFRRILRIRQRILGKDHPDTLTSLNNVADVLRARGDLDDADRLLERVHESRCRVLGTEHPATLVTRYHRANLTLDRGDMPTALAEFRELSAIYDRVMGPDHPRALATRQSLADVLHHLGHVDDAERLTREVLAARDRVFGRDHPATLGTRHRLGMILADRGDRPAAISELTSVLAARRHVLGDRHPDTVLTGEALDALQRAGTT